MARELTCLKVAGSVGCVRQNTHTQGAITARRANQTLVATHHTNSNACTDCDAPQPLYRLDGSNVGVVWHWTGHTALRWSDTVGEHGGLHLSYELAATCRPCYTARPAAVQQRARLAALEAASLSLYEAVQAAGTADTSEVSS